MAVAVTEEAILAVIAREFGRDPEKLARDATLVDLDVGSIDIVSAMFALEDDFGIVVEPDDIARDATLGQFIEHVLKLANK